MFFLTNTAFPWSDLLPTTTPLRFIFIGDSGTGEPPQYQVAKAIKEVCKVKGCGFVIAAGDNIYEFGPKSSADKQFDLKFEKPYAELSFPFFHALGNHDQSGIIPGSGVWPEKGEYEIAYTKKSKKWMLPSRYYSFALPFLSATDFQIKNPNPLAEFFVIDSNPLAPQNKPQVKWYFPNEKFDLEQRAWLKKSIAESNAKWTFVLSHHPMFNNGKHGDAGDYFWGIGLASGSELKKMVQETVCGKVDFLLAGHDHSLQWLKAVESCGARPQFIISGAGAKMYNDGGGGKKSTHASHFEAYEKLGFFWMEVFGNELKVIAYTVKDGVPNIAFESSVKK